MVTVGNPNIVFLQVMVTVCRPNGFKDLLFSPQQVGIQFIFVVECLAQNRISREYVVNPRKEATKFYCTVVKKATLKNSFSITVYFCFYMVANSTKGLGTMHKYIYIFPAVNQSREFVNQP